MNHDIYGILLVDKPQNYTSHDIVNIIRKKTKVEKVGHCGTLDPMATGLLVVLLGRYTKKQDEFSKQMKIYDGKIIFGKSTDTWDLEGKIISESDISALKEDKIKDAINILSGHINQVIPPYSATKFNGMALYKMARKKMNTPVLMKSVFVNWLKYKISLPYLEFSIKCSSGTYIRSIANTIGEITGFPSCLAELRRKAVGEFEVENAVSLNYIENSNLHDIFSKIIL